MKKLKLAIDCDDVLTPTGEWIVEAYNTRHGTNIRLEDFYSTDPDIWGTDTHEEASVRVGSLLRTPEYAAMKPYDDAVASVSRLAIDNELHLVTGRAAYLEPVTNAMLDRYFPSQFETINHMGYFEGEKNGKGEICAELGIDVLVDDHMVHLNDVQKAGLNEVILFGNYPWNQVDSLPRGVERCVTWLDVEREVARLASK